MQISNVRIYGKNESCVASGYPFRTDLPAKSVDPSPKDIDRAKRLSCLDDGHDVFLQGIIIQFDLTCSIKMWTQLERYHFINFVSSQSTMHKIECMRIYPDSANSNVDPRILSILLELQTAYKLKKSEENLMKLLYSVPVGFFVTARLTSNLRQLKTIYRQRKNHQLVEWRDFCKWILNVFYQVDLAC